MTKILRAAGAGLGLLRLALASKGRPTDAPVRKILVLGYSAVGDLIFLLPALRSLRAGLPEAKIVFAANRYPTTEELLPAAGLADEIWTIDAEGGRAEKARARRLIEEARFDAVVASLPTPMRFFARAIAGIPVRAGHCRPLVAPGAGVFWKLKRGLITEEFERRLVFNKKSWVFEDHQHMVVRNLDLIQSLGLKTDDAPPVLPEPPEAREAAERLLAGAAGPKVGLHIGAPQSQYRKIWPPEKWAEVCLSLGAEIVLLGGPEEREHAERFARAYGKPFLNLVGRTSLLTGFAVIKRCALMLSNDTGLAKAAMALRVPTATVWGPSDRPGYGIFWEPDRHLEIRRDMPCAPCVRMGFRQEGRGVINFSNCGHHACLEELTPGQAAGALRARYRQLLTSAGS